MDSANGVASSDGDSIAIPVGDAPHFATAQRFALPTVTQMTALWASLRGGGCPEQSPFNMCVKMVEKVLPK